MKFKKPKDPRDNGIRAIARQIRDQQTLAVALDGLERRDARSMFAKLKPYLKFEAVLPA